MLVLLVSFWAVDVWGGISISPAFVELTLDKGVPAGQFLITNSGNEEERYRIRSIYFIFSSDGGFREMPPDEHSMAQWVKFNPKEFTIPPQARQAIRFVVTPKGKLKAGEYWAAMELESLKTTEAKSTDDKGRTFRFEIIPSIVVPIFGKVGDVRYMGAVKAAKIVPNGKEKELETLIVNTGDGCLFVIGEYEILNEEGQVVAKNSLGRSYLLPGAERKISAEIKEKLPTGEYTIRVRYNSNKLKQPLSEDIKVSWPPNA